MADQPTVRVAVLGVGNVGATLARAWRRAGHGVALGARDTSRPASQALAAELSASLTDAAGAVAGADVVVLALPGGAVGAALAGVAIAAGTLVVDATNTMGGGPLDSRAAVAAAWPDTVYARAFNTVGWENMAEPVIGGVRLDLFWCGPDGAPGALVERLIADTGLGPVRLGGLDQLEVVDGLVKVWFALAIGQGRGRHVGLKVVAP